MCPTKYFTPEPSLCNSVNYYFGVMTSSQVESYKRELSKYQ